jgi:hypothetical protein
MTQKIINGLLALGLIAIGGYVFLQPAAAPKTGGASFVETYPIQFAGGLTAGNLKQMLVNSTGSSLSLGSSTPSIFGDEVLDGTATTTLMVASSGTNKGGCLQLENSLGVATRAYVGSAGNAFVVEAGTCK